VIKNPRLETYWITSPSIAWHAFGVTAFSRDDAFWLLEEAGYSLSAEDPNVRVIEGISLSDLDQNHVVPNAGPLLFRGVWYPQANL